MESNEKEYASALLRAWRHYHMQNSHHMEIRGKIDDMQYCWGAFGDATSFQLLCKQGNSPYTPIKQHERTALLHSIQHKTLEIIAFDTTLNLSMNLFTRLDSGIRLSRSASAELSGVSP